MSRCGGARCLAGSVYFTPDALEWGTRAWAQRASRRDAPGSTGRCRSEDSTAGCRRLHLSHPLELWARPLPLCVSVSFLESGDEKTEVAVQGAGRSERMGSRQAWRVASPQHTLASRPGSPGACSAHLFMMLVEKGSSPRDLPLSSQADYKPEAARSFSRARSLNESGE